MNTKGSEAANKNFTVGFTVAKSPEEVYDAINNVRGWWTGDISGVTDAIGGEFTYRYQDIHYSRQKVTELQPGKRVTWEVLDSSLNFLKEKDEWNGTTITFDIAKKADGTEVRFTHVGLVPDIECYGACSNAWGGLVTKSLKSLITTGAGVNPFA